MAYVSLLGELEFLNFAQKSSVVLSLFLYPMF